MKNKLTEKIKDGLLLAPQMKEQALKFMQDNGFKLNLVGKLVACNEIAQSFENNPELSACVQMAIMSL